MHGDTNFEDVAKKNHQKVYRKETPTNMYEMD